MIEKIAIKLNVQLLFTWNLSPLQSSKFSFEYLLLPPRSDDPYIKRKPCLIVEVLSESTQRIDQSEKKINYQRLDSLKTYLIVHQDNRRIEVHQRLEQGWVSSSFEDAREVVLECPKMVLKLEDVYESVGLG